MGGLSLFQPHYWQFLGIPTDQDQVIPATAGANEILNPAVQVGTLLGWDDKRDYYRWLWVKVLKEYIGR